KFEPGRTAVVLYRLGGRLVQAALPPTGRSSPGLPVADGVTVSAYPDDPGLPGLPLMAQPTALAAELGRALAHPGAEVLDVAPRLVRYRPGRRTTFVLDARVRRGGMVRHQRYVAKVYHDAAKAAAVAAEGRALQAQRTGPDLVLAPVLAHLTDHAVVVQG